MSQGMTSYIIDLIILGYHGFSTKGLCCFISEIRSINFHALQNHIMLTLHDYRVII